MTANPQQHKAMHDRLYRSGQLAKLNALKESMGKLAATNNRVTDRGDQFLKNMRKGPLSVREMLLLNILENHIGILRDNTAMMDFIHGIKL